MEPTISRTIVYPVLFGLRRETVFRDLARLRLSQWRSAALVEELQVRRFRRVAAAGIQSFDFYRHMVVEAGMDISDVKLLDDLVHWPIMHKDHLNRAVSVLRRSRRPLELHSVRVSGGSTGEPSLVLADRETSSRALAARALFQEWHGVRIGDRQIRLWGRPIPSGAWREKLKDRLTNRRRFDSLALSEDCFAETVERIKRFGAEFIYGYASLVSQFVDRLSDKDIAALRSRLKVAITTSETISSLHLRRLQERLGVPVIDEYGCSEVDIISFCCPAGGKHTAAENVLVEVVRQGDEPEGFGHVIVTDLNNTLMPVVRYGVGDLAPLERPVCDCGRGWACIGPVLGRVQNQFISVDGGRRQVHSQFVVYLIERLFIKGWGIGRFQIVQELPDLLILRLALSGAGEVDVGALQEYLAREGREILGTAMRWQVAIVPTAAIEATAAGKYQHFVSCFVSGSRAEHSAPPPG